LTCKQIPGNFTETEVWIRSAKQCFDDQHPAHQNKDVASRWGSRKPFNRVGTISKTKFSFLIKKAPFIMKKVKIMLTAITVFAVVGGALAFKAVKFNTSIFCTTQAAPGACTVLTPGFSTLPAFQGQQPKGNSSCTDSPAGDCAEIPTYVNS
jgi:hypothetical protein